MGKAYQNWDENWGYPYDFLETPTLGAVGLSSISSAFRACDLHSAMVSKPGAGHVLPWDLTKGVPTKEAEAK